MARTPVHPGEILSDELEEIGLTPNFWMNLRSAYELDLARQQNGKTIQQIPTRANLPAEPRPAA